MTISPIRVAAHSSKFRNSGINFDVSHQGCSATGDTEGNTIKSARTITQPRKRPKTIPSVRSVPDNPETLTSLCNRVLSMPPIIKVPANTSTPPATLRISGLTLSPRGSTAPTGSRKRYTRIIAATQLAREKTSLTKPRSRPTSAEITTTLNMAISAPVKKNHPVNSGGDCNKAVRFFAAFSTPENRIMLWDTKTSRYTGYYFRSRQDGNEVHYSHPDELLETRKSLFFRARTSSGVSINPAPYQAPVDALPLLQRPYMDRRVHDRGLGWPTCGDRPCKNPG